MKERVAIMYIVALGAVKCWRRRGKMNCRDCKYWVWDKGIWCINGWSGMDKEDGNCHYEIKITYKHGSDYCHNFKDKKDE